MTRSHDDSVQDQFGPRADAYVQSPVHAAGEDLDASEASAEHACPRHALDLGAGGGHVAYRSARHADKVIAADSSTNMMAAVAETARGRRSANSETCVTPAEASPFANAAFDFSGCRFSAHHWRDFHAGSREARRVSEPGATAVFIDVVSPGPAALDTHSQAVESSRDPSHIRDYTVTEWGEASTAAGFSSRAVQTRRSRMD
ncbi:hypothetical protein OY671_008462, partial [Metschnikowia pulcherrima]